MSTLAEVKLWGRTIGAVYLNKDSSAATFEYDNQFAQSGIEVSPIVMPLSTKLYTFPPPSDSHPFDHNLLRNTSPPHTVRQHPRQRRPPTESNNRQPIPRTPVLRQPAMHPKQ